MNNRRVVVTGLGLVSPVGNDVKSGWQNILAGKSGVALVTTIDVTEYPVKISASVKNFNPEVAIAYKDLKKMDLFIQYGMVAAKEAIIDSGIDFTAENADRCGAAIGSGIGGLVTIEHCHEMILNSGPKRISPFYLPACIINMLAGHVSIEYGLKGPNIAIATACTTGTHNIGFAAEMIRYGKADVMVAGGSEMGTSKVGLAGFAALRALSRRNDAPEKASRPWDKDRDGFVLGDGSGILILEEYEHAKKRNAKIYAEIIGFGMSSDAFHMTLPDETGDGFKKAMQNALTDAKINPEQIEYINAHGTSTPAGDVLEALAIKKAFGDHAKKLAVSSTKSMTGHLLGAAGAVEAIFSILALRDQVLPPTINLDNPDEECDLDFVPHEARQAKLNIVLSNSFGFGGTNGSLVFKKI